jgi:hypothetical protein
MYVKAEPKAIIATLYSKKKNSQLLWKDNIVLAL